VEERGCELYMKVYPRISLQNTLKYGYNGITRDRIFRRKQVPFITGT